MALDAIEKVSGRAVYVPGADIDTDRIIPARFMKCVTFDGLGQYLFYDMRFTEQGDLRNHPLNDPRFAGATVLLADSNFGCGSSREHAPQALRKHGIQAIIAESFAEIFFGNATTLGMPCVGVGRSGLNALVQAVEVDPGRLVTIDLETCSVICGELRCPFTMPSSAREALRRGQWDPIGQLLDGASQVRMVAERLPYLHF